MWICPAVDWAEMAESPTNGGRIAAMGCDCQPQFVTQSEIRMQISIDM